MDDPYYLALLADANMRAGRIDAARVAVETALAHAPLGRRLFSESELHRLTGELLLRLDKPDEAEVRMRKALELAQVQSSPSLELRAALSLARHLRNEGQDSAARELIDVAYTKFTEGFGTHDLVAARGLLEELEA
jgi:predicted ATPase